VKIQIEVFFIAVGFRRFGGPWYVHLHSEDGARISRPEAQSCSVF